MVFRNDDEDGFTPADSGAGNSPGPLIVKIINQKTTRQGINYKVWKNSYFVQVAVMNKCLDFYNGKPKTLHKWLPCYFCLFEQNY